MADTRRGPSIYGEPRRSAPAGQARRAPRPPARRPPRPVPPLRRAAPVRRAAPDQRNGFLRRHFWPPSAFGALVYATVLAVVVALVSTWMFARVDANRPLINEPTTVALGPSEEVVVPPAPPPDTTPTTVSEILSADELTRRLGESVWLLKTRDQSGQAVQGTAFVAGSSGGQAFLLTSLTLVRAGTRAPSPPIALERGTQSATGTLWTWDEAKDLALVVLGRSGEPAIPWMDSNPGTVAGDKLWAGGPARRLVAGQVLSVSGTAVEHNVPVDQALQGAPLVNEKGQVVAVASIAYNPGGTGTDARFTGVPIRAACERLLRCGGGNTSPTATTTTRP